MKKRMFEKMYCAGLRVMLSASIVLASVASSTAIVSAYGTSEETVSEETTVLTANLVKDGSFENVSYDEENATIGAWNVDIDSEAAGTGGSVTLVEDSYTGEQAVRLQSPGNKSGYPEISQTITVLPNTTYYVTLRVRTDYLNALFFGIASEERENETIYGQLHRWGDNSVDVDHNDDDTHLTIDDDEFSNYTLYSASFTTGDETTVRLFIRQEKSDIIIDDVTMTYEGSNIPEESSNLLQNAGFEDSTGVDPLNGWSALSNESVGAEIGIDALDVSTYMLSTQDKQIEGRNTLYLAAKEGFTLEDNITITQEVTVKENTNYSFYVNLSKYGDAMRQEEDDVSAQGIQQVTIGVLGEDGTTVLSSETISGSDISVACYKTFGTMINTGENSVVYPYIEFKSAAGGQWGNCLYVDDCAFYEHMLDLPDGKTNLLSNGDLESEDDWYLTINGESGYQTDSPYLYGSFWMNEWYPYNGIMQSVDLEAGKLYKVTAYVVSYLADWSGTSLNSPASIMVIEGNDNDLWSKISSIVTDEEFIWSDLEEINVVAKQNVVVSPVSNWFYHPITLIFSVPESGEYTIFIGSEYGAVDIVDSTFGEWLGGMNVGAVTLYETSEEELSPSKTIEPADIIATLDTDSISFGADTITVTEGMTVTYFLENVYCYGDYSITIVNSDNSELTEESNLEDGMKILIIGEDGEQTVAEFSITIN
ncbi:MAG: hypothetical protein LUI14_15920 [Lachnospiraceae bacterium]|nr:hypothetical protein [Lachnospiraceae bacterium]